MRAEPAVGRRRPAEADDDPRARPASSARSISSPVPVVVACSGSLPSAPPASTSPLARAISMTAVPSVRAATRPRPASPSGPVTTSCGSARRARRGGPRRRRTSAPRRSRGRAPSRRGRRAADASAAVAVPRNLSSAATTRIAGDASRVACGCARQMRFPTGPVGFRAMAVTVRIPTTLRPLSGGASTVEVEAGTLSDVIAGARRRPPRASATACSTTTATCASSSTCSSTTTTCATSTASTPRSPDGRRSAIIPAVAGG